MAAKPAGTLDRSGDGRQESHTTAQRESSLHAKLALRNRRAGNIVQLLKGIPLNCFKGTGGKAG